MAPAPPLSPRGEGVRGCGASPWVKNIHLYENFPLGSDAFHWRDIPLHQMPSLRRDIPFGSRALPLAGQGPQAPAFSPLPTGRGGQGVWGIPLGEKHSPLRELPPWVRCLSLAGHSFTSNAFAGTSPLGQGLCPWRGRGRRPLLFPPLPTGRGGQGVWGIP